MKTLVKYLLFIFILLAADYAHAKVLTAKSVLNHTYSESLEVKAKRLDSPISKENVKVAKSQYDTYLSAAFSYTDDQAATSNSVFGTQSTNTSYDFSVSQLTPLGTEINLSFLNDRETTNSAFSSLASYYDSRLYFQITQPVLNNLFGLQNRKTVTLAKKINEKEEAVVDQKLQEIAFRNLKLYWQYYMYARLERVRAHAVDSSLKLYRTNKAKMNIGLIEKTDIYPFAANVDLKRSDLYAAQSKLVQTRAKLKTALNLTDKKLSIGKESFAYKKLSSLNDITRKAILVHPQYIAQKKQLKAQDIQVAIDKNNRLPQIDLVGSLTLNGLDPSYGTSVENISDGNTVFQGGVNVSFPLLNKSARANYKKSHLTQKKLLYAIKHLEEQIINDIEASYESYQIARKRMYVLATAVKHQKLKWEGEVAKYDQGRSDPDLVIRYQNDYLDTKQLYIQTQVEFSLAKLELDFSKGSLKPGK